MTESNHKYHGGLGFDLWTNRGAWFWRLARRCCGSSAIGSASTQNEALRDAYAAVEELSARCAQSAPLQVNSPGQHDPGFTATRSEDSVSKPGHNTGDC
jgi:hypothetical protein